MMTNLAFFCYKLIVYNERLRETIWFHGWPTSFLNYVSRLFYIFTAINKFFVKYTVLALRIIDFRKLWYNLNASDLTLFGLFCTPSKGSASFLLILGLQMLTRELHWKYKIQKKDKSFGLLLNLIFLRHSFCV